MVAEQIRELISEALGRECDFSVERPNQAEHGDYASNAALVAAKAASENPRVLAERLQEKLLESDLFDEVDVAGPGFLNFKVRPYVWQQALGTILNAGDRYGYLEPTGKKVQVEFISANPTGPLTLANGRGGFSGDVLARVLRRAGHTVEREYYINDAGNQIVGLGKTLLGEEKVYAGEYVENLKKEITLSGSAADVGMAGAEVLMAGITESLKSAGISFDRWFSERRELHEVGEVEKTLTLLEKAGVTFESDGALWLRSSEFGDDKDRVLRKADGELTYLAADLAYHFDKLAVRKYDLAIDIWGPDHHGYVARMQAGVESLRKAQPFSGELKIIITQLVRLVSDGKEVKMSKRAGTYVALDDLLEQIPADVARFFFVMKSFDTHMDFDLDLAKEQSQKNPVYYLQYAHARVCSILRKADHSGGSAATDLLVEPAEMALIRHLDEFPAAIKRTAADYGVHRIAHYALEVADTFHTFYEQCRVITDDKALTAARLELVRGVQVTLRALGETLGVEMPESM